MKLTNEFEPIRDWADSRGIYDKGDIKTQYLKLLEEVGELSKAILKEDELEFIDAVGDCVIVLTNLVELSNHVFGREHSEDVAGDGGSRMTMFEPSENSIENCINSAYEVIKNRKGKIQNGTFVKES